MVITRGNTRGSKNGEEKVRKRERGELEKIEQGGSVQMCHYLDIDIQAYSSEQFELDNDQIRVGRELELDPDEVK